MDEIIYQCLYYFERQKFTFIENNGSSVKVSKEDSEGYIDNDYFWFPTTPYKMYHTDKWKIVDAFSEISKIPTHKKYWQIKCDLDLNELLSRDDKDNYQVQVNTQDLLPHTNEVTSFLDSYQFLKISSPMATRKSNIIEEVVSQAHSRGQRVLFITNRVSLSHDIADKYHVEHYQTQNYRNGSLVIQFDSLRKYLSNNGHDKFDVVILDEVTSLLLYMTSTYKGKEKIYNDNIKCFTELRSKKFVLADSFIIDFPFKGKTLGICNNFREKLHVTEYLDKNFFTEKIRAKSKHALISVSSNEKKFLLDVKEMLEKQDKRVLLLTADTENKEQIYTILEQSKIPYDAVLFSPTLTVGVSIMSNIEHHFHYDTSGTVSVIDSIQMTRRSRNAKNVHFFIRGRSSYKTTKIDVIRKVLKEPYRDIHLGEPVGLNHLGYFLSHIKQMRNILDNTHKYAFKALLGYQFDDVDLVETVSPNNPLAKAPKSPKQGKFKAMGRKLSQARAEENKS